MNTKKREAIIQKICNHCKNKGLMLYRPSKTSVDNIKKENCVKPSVEFIESAIKAPKSESILNHNIRVILCSLSAITGIREAQLKYVDKNEIFETTDLGFADKTYIPATSSPIDDLSKVEILHLISPYYQTMKVSKMVEKNFKILKDKLKLNQVECDVLHYLYCISQERIIRDIYEENIDILTHFKAISSIFSHSIKSIEKAFSTDGKLNVMGFIELDSARRRDTLLSDGEMIFTAPLDEKYLYKEFGYKPKPSKLSLEDFSYMSKNIDLLTQFIKSSKGGNILLYGEAGVGKNEIVNAIARAFNREIICVRNGEFGRGSNSTQSRINGFNALQYVLDSKSHIACFDECESILCKSVSAFFIFEPQTYKANINYALENAKVINFWLSNSNYMDEAYLRRFDIVLEIKSPPKNKKISIIKSILEPKHIALDDEILEQITKQPNLTQGILTRAASVASKFKGNKAKEIFIKLLNENLKARHLRLLTLKHSNELPYSLDLIECDADINALTESITRLLPDKNNEYGDEEFECFDNDKTHKKNLGIRILGYGIAGSGKSEFAKEIARRTKRELLSFKASDLLSMWVGMSEKHIARAFSEAKANNAILHIDEVDSFLYARESANRSWERTLVNEMLTQMEHFNGVFIATSNHLEVLDSAVIRRFDSKIEFKPLGSEKLQKAFDLYADFLGLESNQNDKILARLARIKNACFGDFALIAREARFMPLKDEMELLARLENECKIKGSENKMGF